MKILRFFLIFLCLWMPLAGVAGAKSDTATVRFVIDGDTVVLSDGRHLRYIGIDAPEIAHEDRPAEPFAEAARVFNAKLVEGRAVVLEFGRQRRDRYGRLLAHVRTGDGTWAAEALLAAGLAHVRPQAPNLSRTDDFLAIQRKAMEEGQGKWRDLKTIPGRVLGNRHSLRFHRPGCPFARWTSPKNRVVFPDRYAAFYAGYAPCRVCFGAKSNNDSKTE